MKARPGHLKASATLRLPFPSTPAPGPVDAAYKAIDSLVRVEAELVDYSVSSVTQVGAMYVSVCVCPCIPDGIMWNW